MPMPHNTSLQRTRASRFARLRSPQSSRPLDGVWVSAVTGERQSAERQTTQRKQWARVREILGAMLEVVDGVQPGQPQPAALAAMREFLRGPLRAVESQLYAALSDPNPVVVGYALFGLSEVGSRRAERLPRSLLDRKELVTEVLGDLRWHGTLGELAAQTQESCRAISRDERKGPRGSAV
jgi:hypothetical protein